MKVVNRYIFLFGCLVFFSQGLGACAQGLELQPSIIDEVAAARGIVERQIEIRNTGKTKLNLYPFVNDVSQSGGKQAFNPYAPDKSVTLSNWIELSRKTIELLPGATTSVPLKIQVHPQAKSGKYYAVISFVDGINRFETESRLANNTDPSVLINLEIRENKVERMEVGDFSVSDFFNFNKQVEFNFALNNSGNQPLSPSGSIIIYDSRGREVSEIKVNEEAKKLVTDSKEPYHIKWSGGDKIGKFKAKLALQYGEVARRDLQDSVYFWILPYWFLGLVGSIILILFISIMVLVLRLSRLKRSLNEDERSEVINLRNR